MKAYKIDREKRSIEFLGSSTKMKRGQDVHASLWFHRNGWKSSGETMLKEGPTRMFTTEHSFVLIGPKWGSIEPLRKEAQTPIGSPAFSPKSPTPADIRSSRLTRRTPWILRFQDADVKACSVSDRTVEIYSVDRMEYTDFVIAKLRLVLEFPHVDDARTFAAGFPKAKDVADLDSSVIVDVDRSTRIKWSKRAITRVALVVAAFPIAIAIGVALWMITGYPRAGAIFSGIIGFLIISALLKMKFERTEFLDMAEKWPKVPMERWARNAKGHAAAFPYLMKDMEVELDLETGDLSALDEHLRGLPEDAFFLGYAWSVAAFVGAVFVGFIGPKTDYEWRYSPDDGFPILHLDSIGYWVSPLSWVASIWLDKEKTTLNEQVETWSENVFESMAFGNIPAFISLGFVEEDEEKFRKAVEKIRADVKELPPISHVVGDGHFRGRVKEYGPFEVHYFEVESMRPSGLSFVPSLCTPYYKDAQRLKGRLEGPSPKSVWREDMAVVRFESAEMVPLGMQIINFPEVGPRFAEMSGTLEFEVLAVPDEVRIVTSRMRETRMDLKDGIAPIQSDEEGLPMIPVSNFIGKIVSVESVENPFSGMQLWKIDVNISGLNLRLVVRKALCDGLPERGYFLSGSAWLVGKILSEARAPTDYIV